MRKDKKDWLERVVGHLLLGGAVALFAIAVTARLQFRHVDDASSLRNRSRSTIQAIEGVTRALLDAETAQRGYLLTGQRKYLEPYYGGIDAARSRLDAASVLIKGDPQQEALWKELHDLVESKLEEFTLAVALIVQHDDAAALKAVRDEDGQRLMNRIRTTGAALVTREEALLSRRTASAEVAVETTERLFWGVELLLVSFFVSGYVLIRRELRARASIGEALKESENALRASERFIKAMADALPALIAYVDHTETYRFVNARYATEFGRDAGSVIGRRFVDVIGTDLYESVRDRVAGALAGVHQHFEREVKPFGKPAHILVDYLPDCDVEGYVNGFHIMITNITERKANEVAVANREQMLRTITDNTPALICYIDRDHHFRFNNRAYERWLARPVAEITGHHLREVYGDEVYEKLRPSLEEALNGVRSSFTMGSPGLDGRLHFARGKYVPHRDDRGQVIGVYGLIVDETKLKEAEYDLEASRRFAERAGEVAGVGGWQFDLRTSELTWTNETCRMHDVPNGHRPMLDEAIGYYAPEARPVIAEAVQRGIDVGEPWDLELPLTSARGRPFWARAVGEVEYEDGEAVRLIGAFQDITRRKRAEQALSDSREMLQVTLESIGDAVITTDTSGHIVWLNPVAERLTGWLKAEAVGKSLLQVFVVVDEESRVPVPDPVRLCLEQGKVSGLADRAVLVSRGGAEYGIKDSTSPIRDAAGNNHGAVLVFHDVSEQRRLSKEMSHRATHDPLTGLVNRSEFEARLIRVLSSAEEDSSNSLLYIDLDQFKLVNDACGHSVGDQLLRQVSSLLTHCVRGRDTVARLGGDEFGVILERCNADQAQKVAQKICDQMEEFRFLHDGRRFRVGASIGLVPVDHRWMNMAAVMQAADASCYAAKEAGRNRVHAWFDTDTAVKIRKGEMQWVTRLEQALDEDRFELYGQRIESISGAPKGLHCEVLLRLRDTDGSIIVPGVFLPAAERFNLATRIDRWVLRRMFEWLEHARSGDQAIDTIAINLSGHSVGDRTFHRDVREMIGQASFDVGCLCFEITETAAVTNFIEAKAFIDEVRGLGVKIALDDFGAGASSFGYLKSLPVDYLKIDGQFIKDVLSDALDNAAVRCFQEVAGIVGVQTIAECVETEEVRSALAGIGIDLVQGWLIHRPAPLEQTLRRPASLRSAVA